MTLTKNDFWNTNVQYNIIVHISEFDFAIIRLHNKYYVILLSTFNVVTLPTPANPA